MLSTSFPLKKSTWIFQKSLSPNLPEDLAISFYLQSHKLIFAVYQLTNIQGTMKFDSYQGECSVPWLNEVLVLFTVSLQLCQQLKDKVSHSTVLIILILWAINSKGNELVFIVANNVDGMEKNKQFTERKRENYLCEQELYSISNNSLRDNLLIKYCWQLIYLEIV